MLSRYKITLLSVLAVLVVARWGQAQYPCLSFSVTPENKNDYQPNLNRIEIFRTCKTFYAGQLPNQLGAGANGGLCCMTQADVDKARSTGWGLPLCALESCEFTFKVKPGFVLSYVKANGISLPISDPSLLVYRADRIDRDLNLVYLLANDARPFFNVMTQVAGPGGTVSPTGTSRVRLGQPFKFSPQPQAGWFFDFVIVNGRNLGPIDTIPSVTGDLNIQVYFKIGRSFTVTCLAGTGGTITSPSRVQVKERDTARFAVAFQQGLGSFALSCEDAGTRAPILQGPRINKGTQPLTFEVEVPNVQTNVNCVVRFNK